MSSIITEDITGADLCQLKSNLVNVDAPNIESLLRSPEQFVGTVSSVSTEDRTLVLGNLNRLTMSQDTHWYGMNRERGFTWKGVQKETWGLLVKRMGMASGLT